MKFQTLFGVFLLSLAIAQAGERKPNIIVIMADDVGYGDISAYGHSTFKTPNIDKLAAEGTRFTSGYCSASTCTPTHYSLLTGTYAFRKKGTGIAPPNGPALIRPGTVTLPSLLQEAGYRTAVIGKWHLGLGDKEPDWNGKLKPGPLEIGFHECFMLPTTNDRVPQVYVQDHKPFFLFLASHDNHVPRIPHERFQGKSGTGLRGDSVIQLDWCVGEIMAALEELGLTENTLVLFCSDNGPVLDDGYEDGSIKELGDHEPSGLFTGGKYTVYEGGTRTPFITRWPGKIPVGVSDEVVCTIDFAASFAALAGVPLPEYACLDSLNILPDDPAEMKDLSKGNPEKTAELIKRLDEIIAAGRSRP